MGFVEQKEQQRGRVEERESIDMFSLSTVIKSER